jgi:hypothetical protein
MSEQLASSKWIPFPESEVTTQAGWPVATACEVLASNGSRLGS